MGLESTVLSLAGEHPVLLRPGAVTPQMLRPFLPDLQPVSYTHLNRALESGWHHEKQKAFRPLQLTDGCEGGKAFFIGLARRGAEMTFLEPCKKGGYFGRCV